MSLPLRQVHLDFHTGPAIPDVGRDFDPAEFARSFQRAHVSSVTVFAKCHHGHLYYDTPRPERHPGLRPGLELLARQVEALHALGIRAPIYLSVQCDEFAANANPGWVATRVDGTRVGRKPLAHDNYAWQILDMSSPYQEYFAEQLADVLKRFHPVDGIFFDMCWDQLTVSRWALDAMRRRNLRPDSPEDRFRHAHDVAHAYMKRFSDIVRAACPEASVYFNSRPLHNLAEEIPFLTQVEIEALPSGGWGYMYFPKNVRFARTLGRPCLGMTARFHKNWADFGGLKPYAALEYETSQMMAHAAGCSIGDQLHPRARLDPAVYDLIGRVYQRVADREPWLEGAVPVTQIAVLRTPQPPEASVGVPVASNGSEEGAVRLLTQLKHQFDLLSPEQDFSSYDLVILPDSIPVSDALRDRLDAHLARGGALLASHLSGLSPDATACLIPALGIQPHGLSPFTATYIRFSEDLSRDVPPTDHVFYDRGVRVTPASPDCRALATVVEPYFERAWDHFSSHAQTPGRDPSPYAAATLNGRAAYIAGPLFSAYAAHGNLPFKLLLRNLLDKLLPEPLLRVTGPSSLEATITRQPQHDNRTIVHLLQYCPERRTPNLDIVEDIVPLFRVPISLKLEKKPRAVYTAPDRSPLDFSFDNGRVSLVLPELHGHAMIVFE